MLATGVLLTPLIQVYYWYSSSSNWLIWNDTHACIEKLIVRIMFVMCTYIIIKIIVQVNCQNSTHITCIYKITAALKVHTCEYFIIARITVTELSCWHLLSRDYPKPIVPTILSRGCPKPVILTILDQLFWLSWVVAILSQCLHLLNVTIDKTYNKEWVLSQYNCKK